VRRAAAEVAEAHAIRVFADNLRAAGTAAAGRSPCWVSTPAFPAANRVIDHWQLLTTTTIYPHGRKSTGRILNALAAGQNPWSPDPIGNGTARAIEQLAAG
jgi:hypothetical protein